MFGKPIGWPMHLLHIQDKTFERRHFYFSYTKSIQTIALCCCTDATSTPLQTCPNQIHISSPLLTKPSHTLLGPQPPRLSGWLRGCFKSPAGSPGSCASWAATNLELGWTWNSYLLVTSPSWLSQTWVKHGETTKSSRIKPSQTRIFVLSPSAPPGYVGVWATAWSKTWWLRIYSYRLGLNPEPSVSFHVFFFSCSLIVV